MPQSLAPVYVHLIFSTKGREPAIPHSIRDNLASHIGGVLRELESPPIAIGVVADHAHVLCRMARTITVAPLVERVKTASSKWIKRQDGRSRTFHWQAGYGAFSVSASKLETVRSYVLNQGEHHRSRTFQEEFLRFLREYRVDFDEMHLWD